jgi:hypothetical protein
MIINPYPDTGTGKEGKEKNIAGIEVFILPQKEFDKD